MKRILLSTAVIIALASPSYAWDARTGGSGPQAIGQDGGSATAQAQRQGQRQTQTQGQHQTATGGAGGQGGRGGNAHATGGTSNVSISGLNSGGGGNAGNGGGGVFLTIPDGRGEAPCGGGIGLGGGGSSAGGGLGGTLWEFSDCKRMRESAALEHLGYHDAAIAELCQIDRVRDAFGGTCPQSKVVINTQADRPDYCLTRNAGDVNQHRECDRMRRDPR